MWFWGYLLYAVLDVGGFLLAGVNTCSGQNCVTNPLWTVSPPGAPPGAWLGIFLAGFVIRLMFAGAIIALGLIVMSWVERRIPLGQRPPSTTDLMAALEAALEAARKRPSDTRGDEPPGA